MAKRKHKKTVTKKHITNQATNEHSYITCLQTFKEMVVTTVTTRFPLNLERIITEIWDGFTHALSAKNLLTNIFFAQVGKTIVPMLDELLKDYPDIWQQSDKDMTVEKLFGNNILYLGYLALILAPFREEIKYRGIITPILECLMQKSGVATATAQKLSVIFSSAYFGYAHAKKDFAEAMSAAAFTFEPTVAKHHGSLWGSIAAHSTLNAVALTGITLRKAFSSYLPG